VILAAEEVMEGQREVVERALGYPFAVPERSFAIVGGGMAEVSAAPAPGADRVPLIAFGSNASPAVLTRKLAADDDPVAVIRVDGEAAALAAVRSRRRSLPELTQRQALEHVRDRLRPGQDLEEFIAACVAGEVPRQGALPYAP
jgi:hypothetical protein